MWEHRLKFVGLVVGTALVYILIWGFGFLNGARAEFISTVALGLPFACLSAAMHGWIGQLVGSRLDGVRREARALHRWRETLTVLPAVVSVFGLFIEASSSVSDGPRLLIWLVSLMVFPAIGYYTGERLDAGRTPIEAMEEQGETSSEEPPSLRVMIDEESAEL